MDLTFASYNIHKAVGLDGRRDPERIIAVLREVHADVIALQEADRRFGERESVLPKALLDETPWRVAPVFRRPRSLGWHGNALLVRKDIEIELAEPVGLPTLEPRGAVRADLVVEGRRVRVLGMHLDLSGLRRRDQIKAILRHCDRCDTACPTVLMGDFNQWGRGTAPVPSSPAAGIRWRPATASPAAGRSPRSTGSSIRPSGAAGRPASTTARSPLGPRTISRCARLWHSMPRI